ncbi:unnamed protein product [Adineta ricciae]|uniref:Uncharacterized protein n=1 Tax=Adineta ricciae TaxID=249248 RepID=A0A814F5Z1_ADIRI|nr:unnamed protein product [Adineta ricciae]
MNWTSVFIFLALFTCAQSKYNPIPVGAVIISTTSQIMVMKPVEYNGTDELVTIFTANSSMKIINTAYDPTTRSLFIQFINLLMNNTIYSCQLAAVEQLDTNIYELPIAINASSINQLTSFTSDVTNRRIFLTDSSGTVTLFSMSGLMQTMVTIPSNITDTVRSTAYSNSLNKLFIITDTKLYACMNFDNANFYCCGSIASSNNLRTISFDQILTDTYVYVLDGHSGIYKVAFDTNGCPTALNPINTLGTYYNLQFVIDRGLYFASGGVQAANDNSILVIANGTQTPRIKRIDIPIVALHISNPNTGTVLTSEETCFNGITYSDYRAAVILAAIFGTIMGIFMCFNALFCIDFVMTKRIIRNLKRQIPHNLLEDRWNKLVEEKYAKIALEKQRRKDDPPPPKRQSTAATRKAPPATTIEVADTANRSVGESLQVPNPIPRLSAYLRRKSESYLSRRRSDDYRSTQSRQRDEVSELPSRLPRGQAGAPQIHIAPVQEENENQRGLRSNLSRQELLKDADFL